MFGGAKKDKDVSAATMNQSIRDTRRTIAERMSDLKIRTDHERFTAVKLGAKNDTARTYGCLLRDPKQVVHLTACFRLVALQALRRAKLFELEMKRLAKVESNIETLAIHIENVAVNQSVMDTFKLAARFLEQSQSATPVSVADNLAIDLQDAFDNVRSLTSAISQPIDAGGEVYDEDDLVKELDALLNEQREPPRDHQQGGAPAVAVNAPTDLPIATINQCTYNHTVVMFINTVR
jgi:hypothetical protein